MQEEGEKLERSLQSKIQERIATDQRLRALIEEEIRLTNVFSSHVNEETIQEKLLRQKHLLISRRKEIYSAEK